MGMTVGATPEGVLATRPVGGGWEHLLGDAVGVPYEFRAPGLIGKVRWFIGMRGTEVVPLVDALMVRSD
jgi:hypothetical protein